MTKRRIEGLPPDQAERERIVRELDRNLLVEAAAGSGKTTSLVARMLALLETGQCEIGEMAAMTFTRKAAGELRGRFQLALASAASEATGTARGRLEKALRQADAGFIGTIHSFCGRLLRERPVEAGIRLPFREMDAAEDAESRQAAWESFLARLYAEDAPILAELRGCGLSPTELNAAYADFSGYPDVEHWPGSLSSPPKPEQVLPDLHEYLRHMAALAQHFSHEDGKSERLKPLYRRLPRLARVTRFDQIAETMELLRYFKPFPEPSAVVFKGWPTLEGTTAKELAKGELERWNAFAARVEPLLEQWRAYRYGVAQRFLTEARQHGDLFRHASSTLNFQDLLQFAARLLRDQPKVRRYFQARWRCLLVDEFQDTDPLQAEILMLLASTNPEETNWRRCRPRPGALFVVGDPQQSIYRFRRADLVTYSRFKQQLREQGGAVVQLTANFRARPELVDWVNGGFADLFPAADTDTAPAHRPMLPGRSAGGARPVLFRLVAPVRRRGSVLHAEEASHLADFIAGELATDPARNPSDYLILAPRKKYLSVYAEALRLRGIPCEVTGGNALSERWVLRALLQYLEVLANPADGVALVALARGPLYGFSDVALHQFREAGGRFTAWRVPPGLPQETQAAWQRLMADLSEARVWFDHLPLLAAVLRLVEQRFLVPVAWLRGEPASAAALSKGMELLRTLSADSITLADLARRFRERLQDEEREDGLMLPSEAGPAVRVMNLHKAKGLEAHTVFLVDPKTDRPKAVNLHVDRRGDHAVGYWCVREPSRGWAAGEELAAPVGWGDWRQREGEFLDAEAIRLLYVAATRAAERLVISEPEKAGEHYWSKLVDNLRDAPELPRPEPPATPAGKALRVTAHAVREVADELAARYRSCRVLSWRQQGVKAEALAGLAPLPATQELGTDWGTLVHALLQQMFQQPTQEVAKLVELALADREAPTPPEWPHQLEQLLKAVEASDLWRRANAALETHFEMPFSQLAGHLGQGEELLLEGQIDLLFREEGGWVLVDFKTDRQPMSQLGALVERYRPQVLAYAELWSRCQYIPVQECHLYFTHHLRDEVVYRLG